ncbi:MAG: hypothetical protein QM703_13500 [Gemmatales bacterium]
MKFEIWNWVLSQLCFVVALSATAPILIAQDPPVRVAITGTAAPAGGTYSGFNVNLALNDSWQVAFLANLTGASPTMASSWVPLDRSSP